MWNLWRLIVDVLTGTVIVWTATGVVTAGFGEVGAAVTITTEVTVLRGPAELLAAGTGGAGSLQFAINFITTFPHQSPDISEHLRILQVTYLSW